MFRTQGYAGTTVRKLGTSVGIKGASIYYHIPSKEILLYEICKQSLVQILYDFDKANHTNESSPDQLSALIAAHTKRMLADQDMHATMLSEFRELSEDHRAEIGTLRTNYELKWRSFFAAGQEQGWVRADIDAKYLTLALLNMLNRTSVWYQAERDPSPIVLADIYSKTFITGMCHRDSGA